jgi:transposase-like protein
MALSQSDLMRLLESLRTADGVETIRVLCERILQELIEAEATEAIGAAPGEHSDQRTTWRNGHRERLLTTQAGDLDLKIPKVRTGIVLPLSARTPAAYRPGSVRRGDGGVCARRLDPLGR